MKEDKQQLCANFAHHLMGKMFKVQKGETVAITADSGSDAAIIQAMADAAEALGGIPLVMWIPRAKADSQAGMKYWPAKALTAALCEVDVWIEAQSAVILYSDIWETAMRENKKLRYLIIADSSISSLNRVFTGFDISLLNALLCRIRDMFMKSTNVRITSANGTDVEYSINLAYSFDIDDGDFSNPKFGTAPGFVNIVPREKSMKGRIVFDHLQHSNSEESISFVLENGKITTVEGGEQAEKFSAYLAAFEDPNMYKISHNMIGLNPNIHELTGELVEDERIWGGVDFGFGHTSAIDMPPLGQIAKSHFDGVVAKTSIYLDGEIIIENGVVVHENLRHFADRLLSNSKR